MTSEFIRGFTVCGLGFGSLTKCNKRWLLTAEVKLLVWIVSTVIVSITLPLRLDTYVVLALKQEGGAVCTIGKAGRWKSQSFCQTKSVTFTPENQQPNSYNPQAEWNHEIRIIKNKCTLYSLMLLFCDSTTERTVKTTRWEDTHDMTSHQYSPDSPRCHHIWNVQRYSVHSRTESSQDDKSATLQHRQTSTKLYLFSDKSILYAHKRGVFDLSLWLQ